jgi:transposase
LYLKPPERAVVLCFDEKTHTQALDRTRPSLPMKPGRAGAMTHDYKRHGNTDLFAVLNVATGEVLTDCRKSHDHQDFLAFLRLIDLHVPKDLEIHLVLENLSAHKHENVARRQLELRWGQSPPLNNNHDLRLVAAPAPPVSARAYGPIRPPSGVPDPPP